MSTPKSKTRRLSECVKCTKCREARQKCIWSGSSQRCDRCVRFKHPCSSGTTSDRAQRSQNRAQRRQRPRPLPSYPDEQMIAISNNTQHGGGQETCSPYSAGSRLSQMSRATSCGYSTLLSTPNTQELVSIQQVSGFAVDRNPLGYLSGVSRNQIYEWFQACYEYDTNLGQENLLKIPYTPKKESPILTPYQTLAQTTMTPTIHTHMLPGLTNLRPSRNRTSTPMEARLENRIVRLWDNEEVFTNAKSSGFAVTPLFGRAFSKLFRWSRQLAEHNEMVRQTRYACGAADAWMNTKLSAKTRGEYLLAYNCHDSKARSKIWQAVHAFAEKVREGESPDVMPLYIATFLHHAAGACIRGGIDVDAATAAFNYYNGFTKSFPIRLMRSPTSNGQWAVDMLLVNNDEDPGMRISSLMFALGRKRLELDKKEGLC